METPTCPCCNGKLNKITYLLNRFHCFNCGYEIKYTPKEVFVYKVLSDGSLRLKETLALPV